MPVRHICDSCNEDATHDYYEDIKFVSSHHENSPSGFSAGPGDVHLFEVLCKPCYKKLEAKLKGFFGA